MNQNKKGARKQIPDAKLLAFLAIYTREHGYSPNVREIGDGVGLHSTAATTYRLKQLVSAGLLVKRPKGVARAYALPPTPRPV